MAGAISVASRVIGGLHGVGWEGAPVGLAVEAVDAAEGVVGVEVLAVICSVVTITSAWPGRVPARPVAAPDDHSEAFSR